MTMTPLMKARIASGVRFGLAAIVGILATLGHKDLLTGEQMNTIAEAVAMLAGLATLFWGQRQKTKADEALVVALAMPGDSTRHELDRELQARKQ